MRASELRDQVRAGATVAGGMVFEFFSPGVAQLLQLAGCRFVIYDMEHTGIGLETIKWQVSACRGLDIVPMVRVPRGEYAFLAGALDVGVKGVMIPMVESADQARAIAEATHYPPHGRRGAAFGFAHDDYTPGPPATKISNAQAETLVIAQIETERGLENVDDIASIDGIDVLWVGHFDLTNFLGIPGDFESPNYKQALERVVAAGKKYGKGLGFMAADGTWAKNYRALGFNMLAAGPEHQLMARGMADITATVEASS
ncbi:MAG: aldolase/citrate lyase family protein [Pseudomonadota bacterium]